MEHLNLIFKISGAILWAVLVLAVFAIILRILWDGFRALTISIWGCRVCKKKTGSYLHKGMIRWFFHNWFQLLGTRSGSFSLNGPGGYWHEWNDWRVYGIRVSGEQEGQ